MLESLVGGLSGNDTQAAGVLLLRLPQTVAPVFLDWLKTNYHLASKRVESLIRSTRDGLLHQSEFGCRMRGEGPYAEGIRQSFRLFARKYWLSQPLPPLDCSLFRRPATDKRQLRLF